MGSAADTAGWHRLPLASCVLSIHAILVTLFPAADALHGPGHPHSNNGRGVVAGVLEATLECGREL